MTRKKNYPKFFVTPLEVIDYNNPANRKAVLSWDDELEKAKQRYDELQAQALKGDITDESCRELSTLILKMQSLQKRIQKYSCKDKRFRKKMLKLLTKK